MKKKYLNPQTIVVTITPAKMIALSGKLDKSQQITNSDNFGSRRGGGSSWEDDEE